MQRWGDQGVPPAGRGSAVECEVAWQAPAVVPCIVGEVPRLMDVSDVFDNLPDLVHSAGAVGVHPVVALLVDQVVLHCLWYPRRWPLPGQSILRPPCWQNSNRKPDDCLAIDEM